MLQIGMVKEGKCEETGQMLLLGMVKEGGFEGKRSDGVEEHSQEASAY